MNDNLFALLLSLFAKTLNQLKKLSVADHEPALSTDASVDEEPKVVLVQLEQINSPKPHSIRVFTKEEQRKLSKASHQFLMRMSTWGVVAPEAMELIINRLVFSDSRYVSLQETKWVIRQTLARDLTAQQLAFLELVLYQREDSVPLH